MSGSSFLGSGWSFPPTFEPGGFTLGMTHGAENIAQSIDLILQTPVFSRSLQPDFGANLSSFLFRALDTSLQEEIIQEVKSSLLNHEPRIKVESVEVQSLGTDDNTLLLTISYVIKHTNTRHNHVFPFSILEGTHLKTQYRV